MVYSPPEHKEALGSKMSRRGLPEFFAPIIVKAKTKERCDNVEGNPVSPQR
jgi:hypothetical protein